MANLNDSVPTPQTVQDLERAIQDYRKSDSTWSELVHLWEAIRSAALALKPLEPKTDPVPGEDSY